MEDFIFHTHCTHNAHFLLDIAAPKTIYSEAWLEKTGWKSIKRVVLYEEVPPFRFSGHHIRALYGVCLSAVITDIKGSLHTLNLFSFVLPDVSTPFLLGLKDQRLLDFDICLRLNKASHLKISNDRAPTLSSLHHTFGCPSLLRLRPETSNTNSIPSSIRRCPARPLWTLFHINFYKKQTSFSVVIFYRCFFCPSPASPRLALQPCL